MHLQYGFNKLKQPRAIPDVPPLQVAAGHCAHPDHQDRQPGRPGGARGGHVSHSFTHHSTWCETIPPLYCFLLTTSLNIHFRTMAGRRLRNAVKEVNMQSNGLQYN